MTVWRCESPDSFPSGFAHPFSARQVDFHSKSNKWPYLSYQLSTPLLSRNKGALPLIRALIGYIFCVATWCRIRVVYFCDRHGFMVFIFTRFVPLVMHIFVPKDCIFWVPFWQKVFACIFVARIRQKASALLTRSALLIGNSDTPFCTHSHVTRRHSHFSFVAYEISSRTFEAIPPFWRVGI